MRIHHAVSLVVLAAPLLAQTSGCEDLSPLNTYLLNGVGYLQVPGLSVQITKASQK